LRNPCVKELVASLDAAYQAIIKPSPNDSLLRFCQPSSQESRCAE